MSKRKYSMVVVDWEDATHQTGYWRPLEAKCDKGHMPIMCRTVGFLTKNDRKRVVLAQEYFLEDDDLRYIAVIPRGMVRKITRLKEVESGYSGQK